jgi:hypothetical protein
MGCASLTGHMADIYLRSNKIYLSQKLMPALRIQNKPLCDKLLKQPYQP